MTTRLERRTQSRKRPVSLVYVELPPANGGMMRDLSEFGFSMRAMMPLQPSEKVAFSFILDSSARIDGDAIVVRLEDRGYVAALEFAGLSAQARDRIRVWLDKYDESSTKESAKPVPPPGENSTFEELRTELRSTEARPISSPKSPPKPPRVQLPVFRLRESEPPAVSESTQEELPSLLKLSSVRPEAPPEASEGALLRAAEVEEAEVTEPASVAPETPPEEKPEPLREPATEPGPEAEVPPVMVAAEPVADSERATAVKPLFISQNTLEPLSSPEAEAQRSNQGWMESFTLTRAIGIMLLLTAIAGSLVYRREIGHGLVWLGQKIAGDEISENPQLANSPATMPPAAATSENATSSPAEQSPNTTAPASSDADSSTAQGAEKLPPGSQNTPAPQVKDSNNSAIVPLNQADRPAAPPKSSELPMDGGQQEYQRAQAILHAANRNGELPEAIRLLWAAVEKGNVGAEITLAELYRMGRGVTKNCAQAKVLLATAAKKGSPDAQRRLEALQSEGCQE
jgi:hypothetical protein